MADCVMRCCSLAKLELARFDLDGGAKHLNAAQAYLDAARKVFTEALASKYLSQKDEQQDAIDKRWGQVGGG